MDASSALTVTQYDASQLGEWNSFVAESNGGTLFHRLDFLAYHGDRFRHYEHPLSWHKQNRLYGIMPMAVFEQDGYRTAKSPYGGSYGGAIFKKVLNYEGSCSAIAALNDYLTNQNINEIILTPPISPCYRVTSQTFELALLEKGYECINQDISSVISLSQPHPASQLWQERIRKIERKAKKAIKAGIAIVEKAPLEDFWQVANLTFQKHGVNATHTPEELRDLNRRFPDGIYADIAYLDSTPIAAVGYFIVNAGVVTSFYLCSDGDYQQYQALTYLLSAGIHKFREQGYQWLDLGTSSAGMKGRPNIFRFKESLGAIGFFRKTYRKRF